MRQRNRYIPRSGLALLALDVATLVVTQGVLIGAAHTRLQLASNLQIAGLVCVYAILETAFLYSVGSYRRDILINPIASISRLPIVVFFSGVLFFPALHYGAAALFPKTPVFLSVSGSAIIVLMVTGLAIGAGIVSRTIFHIMVRRHWFRRKILVIGTGRRAAHLEILLNNEAQRSLTELIFLPQSVLGPETPAASVDLVQSSLPAEMIEGKNIEDLVSKFDVDEIVVAADERRGLSIERLLLFKSAGIAVADYPGFIEQEAKKIDLRWADVGRLVYSDGFQMRELDVALKRVFDILVSFVLLFLTFPLMVFTCFCVYFESGLPVFYRQERVTKGGRTFKLNKIRTMYVDAEKEGPRWASQRDRRVTRVGGFLRRTRIDEIPQLLNVIVGDMSLVGPRPERPVFIEQLAKKIPLYDLRHSVRAGLTGWAQINYPYGASEEDSKHKLEYDLYYIKNYSIIRDALILLQTLRVVLWPQAQNEAPDQRAASRTVNLDPKPLMLQRLIGRKSEPV